MLLARLRTLYTHYSTNKIIKPHFQSLNSSLINLMMDAITCSLLLLLQSWRSIPYISFKMITFSNELPSFHRNHFTVITLEHKDCFNSLVHFFSDDLLLECLRKYFRQLIMPGLLSLIENIDIMVWLARLLIPSVCLCKVFGNVFPLSSIR